MEIFKLSHRQRYLKVWLIAIACQAGQLFAQIESSLYEDYPRSDGSEANWNSSQFAQDANFDSYPFSESQNYSSSTNNYWEIPQGISQDQVQELIYPNDSSRFSYPLENQSYDTPSNVAVEGPQNGQWPATSNNAWQDISEIPYYTPYNPQDTSETSQNNQWPAPNDNEWQNQNVSSTSDPAPFPPSDSQFKPYTEDSINQSNESKDVTTSQRAEDFASFPRAEQKGADKQNFTTFDPLLAEGPDNIQHPLSKNGEATSYPFGSEASTSSTQIHSKDIEKAANTNLNNNVLKEKKPDNPKIEDSNEQGEMPQSLSQGKSNIKLVKKRPDPIPPAQRLEEALNQPEVVIGKQIVTDPVVGLVDDSERQSLSNDTFLHATPLQKRENSLSQHTLIRTHDR